MTMYSVLYIILSLPFFLLLSLLLLLLSSFVVLITVEPRYNEDLGWEHESLTR